MLKIILQPLYQNSFPPSTYASIFQFLVGKNFVKLGQQVHAHMAVRGVSPNGLVAAKMVAMYASSGEIDSASYIFDSATEPSSLLYNAMIRALTLYGITKRTIEIFFQMHSLGFRGDNFTFPFVFKSCADLSDVWCGKCVHSLILRSGFVFDMYVGTSLVDMYVKCGDLIDARKLFDEMPVRDVSAWNVLIAGYMKDGLFKDAEELFEEMPIRNIVSWTAMISGYAQNGLADESLQLFDKMLDPDSEVRPNWVTVMSVLPACAHSAALDRGKKIHSFAREAGLEKNPSVQTALIAMYAKCGSLVDARLCFDQINPREKKLVAWNTMITAYASHGFGREAVSTFEDMLRAGIQPDKITFTGLLSGCSHSGLVDVGLRYFDCMSLVYFVEKGHDHYACVVDLLGRAGRLVEAYNLISQMPMAAGPSIWGSLLAAGRSHRNLEIAELAAKKLFILEPDNSGNYIVLSNMYAEAGMWEEVTHLRIQQKSRRIMKSPGCSWIEFDGKAHLFLGGDTSHPQAEQIYLFLEALPAKIKAAGYMPDTTFALHDVSEEEKEQNLSSHSERLAIAFGILNTSPGTVLRVTKNLRICGDCHTAIKLVSKIYEREIIVRDVNRFHHFKDGSCSCRDYW
uniref:DYW domain-containing protein n=2 Tax=Solanum lycopersicum TaxID=4081 RepID=A0A3Q7EQ75_SOLLC